MESRDLLYSILRGQQPVQGALLDVFHGPVYGYGEESFKTSPRPSRYGLENEFHVLSEVSQACGTIGQVLEAVRVIRPLEYFGNWGLLERAKGVYFTNFHHKNAPVFSMARLRPVPEDVWRRLLPDGVDALPRYCKLYLGSTAQQENVLPSPYCPFAVLHCDKAEAAGLDLDKAAFNVGSFMGFVQVVQGYSAYDIEFYYGMVFGTLGIYVLDLGSMGREDNPAILAKNIVENESFFPRPDSRSRLWKQFCLGYLARSGEPGKKVLDLCLDLCSS